MTLRHADLTEPQRIVLAAIEREVQRTRELGWDIDPVDLGLLVAFHEPDAMSVDGTLYDILAYGHAEFGYGKELYRDIYYSLHEAGYLMERDTNCDYRFYKDTDPMAIDYHALANEPSRGDEWDAAEGPAVQ